jgi:hypothetical protein
VPLTTSDLKFFYSGGAGKTAPDGQQGGTISTTNVTNQDLTTTVLVPQTMWKDVTNTERVNGVSKYHCFYIKNTHGTITATNLKLFQNVDTVGVDFINWGYSGNPPNTPEQTPSSTTQSFIYKVAPTPSESALDDDRERAGILVPSDKSPLFDKAIVQIDSWLIRHGNPSTSSPLTLKVREMGSGNVKATFGSLAVDTISTTATSYTFTNLSNTYKMKVDDVLSWEYDKGSSSNYVSVVRDYTDPVNFSQGVNYDGSDWRNLPDADMSCTIWIGGVTGIDSVAPTGITFSNPNTQDNAILLPDLAPGSYVGVWAKLTVPINAGAHPTDKSELTLQYDSPA